MAENRPPDDFIDPKTLNPLARSYLRSAFRAIASCNPDWHRAFPGHPVGLIRHGLGSSALRRQLPPPGVMGRTKLPRWALLGSDERLEVAG
jgi:hypothetical protein